MKVQITKSSHNQSWNLNKIGEAFTIVAYPKDNDYWQVVPNEQHYITRLIKKHQCKVVEETIFHDAL